MKKEKINLLDTELLFTYYKNNNFADKYRFVAKQNNLIIDNEILDNLKDYLYITTLDKYNEMQQQLKKQKEVIEEAIDTLQIGVNTYNNEGSRRALFEVISEVKGTLEDVQE